MKKIKTILLTVVAGVSLLAFTLPGDSFEGIITYTMSLGADTPPQVAAMMQGNSTKIYVKGDKARTEVTTGMYKSVTISDRKTKEEITLVDMQMTGSKYEIKPDPSKTKPEQAPDIKYIDSTKVIAGYTCKAAIVTVTSKSGEKYSGTVFYTDQLPYSEDMGKYKGLKGCPMQYTMKQQGMSITLVAQSVVKQSLSDTLFAIPTKGYKVVSSREEMQKDIQQQMGGGGGQ